MHTHIYIHTYIYIHTNTYIYIYIYIYTHVYRRLFRAYRPLTECQTTASPQSPYHCERTRGTPTGLAQTPRATN